MLINLFLEYLRTERNYSEYTIQGYGTDLREFEMFFTQTDQDLQWTSVDADVIRRWVMHLMDTGKGGLGRKSSSVNRKLSSLRSFFHFLLQRGYVKVDPASTITGPKRSKVLPYFLRESEMDELLDKTDFGEGFEGQRDKLIIDMFYSTGMRLAELVGLTDGDIDFSAKNIKVTGKRNKQRLIPFGDELQEAIAAYKARRNETLPERTTEAFFVKANGQPVTRSLVYNIVRKNLSKVTSIKKRSPHVLRHTFATTMLNHSAELESVKELLGHSSLNATQIYTHTTFEELKKIYKQAHPRA